MQRCYDPKSDMMDQHKDILTRSCTYGAEYLRTVYIKHKEVLLYLLFGGRLFTLAVEEVMLAVFISWLGMNSMAVKLTAQVLVIVLNYVISKLFVFKK